MALATITIFFVIMFGLGFTATYFLKNNDNFFERNIMRVGVGMGVFISIAVILNLFSIPLYWWIFLVFALIFPIIFFVKNYEKIKPSFKLTQSNIFIGIALIIFLASAFMYISGSFSYPYLENDDPWEHVISAKYVSLEKHATQPANYGIQYMDPYPPGYAIFMGVLHQTNDSIKWTLKFFNGLIIALGILFFYFFTKELTKSRTKAIFSTFVLAAIPSYFTHFIWAHTLVIALFFPLMYSIKMMDSDKNWRYIAMVLFAAVLFTQPSQALKIAILVGLYFIIKSVYEMKLDWDTFFVPMGGVTLSMAWWATRMVGMFSKSYTGIVEKGKGIDVAGDGIISKALNFITKTFAYDSGTASRPYSFQDFFFAEPLGSINVHLGWGIIVSILVLFGILYLALNYKDLMKKENYWMGVIAIWFMFTFLGTNSMSFGLPIGLFAFRFWLLLAIPVAILSSLGLWQLFKFGNNVKFPALIIILLIIAGIIGTSGYQKYNHNTLPTWPPGSGWASLDELQSYTWLDTLPANTKVFSYSDTDKFILGYDLYSCPWCPEIKDFRDKIVEKSPDEIHSFLKKNQYEYLIISQMSQTRLQGKFGSNETQSAIMGVLDNIEGKYQPAHQTNSMVALKVI